MKFPLCHCTVCILTRCDKSELIAWRYKNPQFAVNPTKKSWEKVL